MFLPLKVVAKNPRPSRDEGLAHCYIESKTPAIFGGNVSITPGVKIGDGVVLALGSVVTKEVPPLAIVDPDLAKVIMMQNAENYERLKKEGKFS